MLFYLSFLFATILSYFEKIANLRFLFSLLLFSFAALLLGLRDVTVGIDTEEYYWIYFLANERPWHHYVADDLEPVFIAFNKLFGFFGFSASWFIFTVSLFVILSVAVFIHRYSPSLLLGWICFLGYGHFFQFHNTMRQSIALAILLFSIPYILKRNFSAFAFFVILASGVHYSAVVFIALYFIYGLRVNRAILVFVWLISLLFVFESTLFFKVLDFISWAIPSSYSGFIDDERIVSFGGQGLGVRLFAMQIILLLMVYLYRCFVRSNHLYEFEKRNSFFLLVGMIAIILGNVFYHVGLISRLLHYFSIFLLIAIPLLPFSFRKKERLFITGVFSAFFLLLFLRGLVTDPHGVFPYSVFSG